LVLSAMFIFFVVVVWRASVEAMEIFRQGYREERELYRSTLGNREFAEELGKRVAERNLEDSDEDGAPVSGDDD
jgi:hypothetical protein